MQRVFKKSKGKTYRKSYRDKDSRDFDYSCRNNGSCKYCQRSRKYKFRKGRLGIEE